LPPYALDLNPVDWLWKHRKHVELRYWVCWDLERSHRELHRALGRVRPKPNLVPSCFEGAGLELSNLSFPCNAQFDSFHFFGFRGGEPPRCNGGGKLPLTSHTRRLPWPV